MNDEGWIVTVAHLLQPLSASDQHAGEINEYKEQERKINADLSLNVNEKQRRIAGLRTDPKWITNISFWWAKDGHKISRFELLPEGDLAIGRLDNFDSKWVSNYPIIKDPKDLRCGTSLCKLGFPFHNPQATFDEATGNFALQSGTLPVSGFPIDGIFTRNVLFGKSGDGKYDLWFLETSSPGLRGQSGGPIFDVRGTVWAIQSRTQHFPLGFSPKVIKNGQEVEENQFLNVGLGVHPSLLVAFLKDQGVNFKMSDY